MSLFGSPCIMNPEGKKITTLVRQQWKELLAYSLKVNKVVYLAYNCKTRLQA